MIRLKQAVLIFVSLLSLGIATVSLLPATGYAATLNNQPCQPGDDCDTFINKYINPFIKLLTVSIGIFAAISIVVAGIQYATAAGDSGQVQKAKERLYHTILGLLAYIFLFAFLNYIVPGGVLH